MRPTDLAFNRSLGMRDAPAGAPHLLELPWDDRLRNHVGTMHAAAQFALAEAASAACLQRSFPELDGRVLAVVRRVDLRYRQAATGDLRAFGTISDEAAAHGRAALAQRGMAFLAVDVELRDPKGVTTFVGTFTWYVTRLHQP